MKTAFIHPTRFWGLFLYILFIAFISLWQRDRMHRIGYAIHDMEQQKAERVKLHKALLIKVERLNALDRIEQIALTRLSMVPASSQERVSVRGASQFRKSP